MRWTHSYDATGAHRMSGCARHVDYFLACTDDCIWLGAPFEAAAFALGCPVELVTARQVTLDRVGAAGCGRQVTYLAVCDLRSCRWVQEGSAAAAETVRAAEDSRRSAPSHAGARQ